ncbi:iron-sulfur cluster assembly accessory protein [uncultured Vibrio sp.]|uniref:iron-sulfur cluster assembly accessory protein n=1 Tax=uncultured Vibrio sp. TaxID=114054 RepID=UPI00091B8081|nr:iron-sulfur cluster assembly accessory protein [uncultured Vibrio sp.]OIQ25768.1 MAG: FeS assembly scaffold protein SufA [Vibrio sp. MedPE-SWchi]
MVSKQPDVMGFSPKDATWLGITLSPSASKRISQLSGDGQSILLTVKSSGCTGYAYVLKQISEPDEDTLKFESNGSTIYVSLSAMPFVDGTEVDYVREGLNQNFVYRNPNVKSECGCGESFGI